ncbi:putative RNA polymerases M/15 Kd subunit [Elsinoe australis]|uniref:Putative RNA polymerases M/15 Kd subunit n=1 Tax=Elsinoe australis TaxID=40998 RepID=A0A4U7B8D3_9PEZI|nr:putative RNA polymerases M/15 Kd subunit [Elsinoe australis]
MSAYDSPKDDVTEESKPKKIEFRFCKECANMLYPREDRTLGTLTFQCRNCQFSEEVGPVCIYRNELSNTVGETSGVTQDVASDPTVGEPSDLGPIIPDFCTFCGQEILCPTCGDPTDGGQCLVVTDDDSYVDGRLEREVNTELLAAEDEYEDEDEDEDMQT